jgi:carbamoyltransferase
LRRDVVAGFLARGEVIGWFQGRMEFGPRAGCRSSGDAPTHHGRASIADKFREGFRPFAPAVLEEHCAEYFAHDRPSPYMTFVVPRPTPSSDRCPPTSVVSGLDRLKSRARACRP